VPSYPAGMSVSNRAVIMLGDELRHHRMKIGTRWRRLEAGQQALLTLARLRKGETFAIGTTTVYRYLREASGTTRKPGRRAGRRGGFRPGCGYRACP
jgi:hypothetical protein